MAYTDQSTPWFEVGYLEQAMMRTYDDYYSVHTVFEYNILTQGHSGSIDYKLELQRYGAPWTTIATKYGTAKDLSWQGGLVRGHVSFNNIGKYNKLMRIKITTRGKVFYTGVWVR